MTDPRLDQEVRARCLSATDIVGIKHYGKALAIWAKKLKGIEPTFDARSEERMLAGKLFEEPIFKGWYKPNHCPDSYSFSPSTMEHSNGWLCATPDYIVRIAPRLYRLVEVKTRSTRATTAPEEWVDQLHIQWHVLSDWLAQRGLGEVDEEMHVACCHMQWGPEFRRRDVELDPERLNGLFRWAYPWWERHIKYGEKPSPGHSKADTDALGLLYPGGDSGQYHVAPEWVTEAHSVDATYQAQIRELKRQQDELRNRLRDLIGDADGLVREGSDREVLWSWRQNRNGTRYLRRHG